MQDFRDKVAVITGAASGIGSALAGMSASECAAKVFQGMRDDRFWIFTHDEFKPALAAHCESVPAGRNPQYNPFNV